MIRILDLFSGKQSMRKSSHEKWEVDFWMLNPKTKMWTGYQQWVSAVSGVKETLAVIEYFGVDVKSPQYENLILDLSQDNIIEKLDAVLPEGWKPDFIWASPLCTTFSRATCIPGGTLSYELDENDRVKIRENFEIIEHKAYVKHKNNPEWIKKQQIKGKLGLDLLNNTKKIVEYYKVPFAIENPSNALSRYELVDYVRNVTQYCMYGFPYKKSTAIYTNKPLTLLKCNHRKHEQVMSGFPSKTGIKAAPNSNADRSVVPPKLIADILEQLLEGVK